MTTTQARTIAQLHADARARFGEDHQTWACKCPTCGHVDTLADVAYVLSQQPAATAREDGRTAAQVLGQQCTACGARAADVGPVEVRLPDGRTARVFELAPKP
ncbi:hypothetical protein NGM33_28470 [Nocardiopsis dassonvillei]|uniref:VVA0879 family protein n=1 Tax=Nocardiopsis dassonvillei TaxID=2014 RepID=UPI0020A2900D|nr:VVA0879 family protein [Nocardiopsis dassonvillei]MCP3017271.1 hypothetical protein [Nocardiopsis dassonvillei]